MLFSAPVSRSSLLALQQIDIPPLLHLQQEADINLMADKKKQSLGSNW